MTAKQIAIIETFNALLKTTNHNGVETIHKLLVLGIGYDEFKDAVIACGNGDEIKLHAALGGRPISTWW
jgi:hypothetical protein